MYKRGKVKGVSEMLEGYEKLMKDKVEEPIEILDVVKGMSEENGLFIYVCSIHKGVHVYVSVPTSSLETFRDIDTSDLEEIRKERLKMYIESHTSKKGRLYYTAYIDE